MTCIRVLAALVAAVAVVVTTTSRVAAEATVAAAKESTMADVSPEHARLTAMSGTWDINMTFWFRPGAPGVPSKALSTIRPLFDGTFIEERIEGALNGTPFTTLAWTGFNTSTHMYEATRIASTNTVRIAETGGYDEATRQFELKAEYAMAGDTWRQRTVIRVTSADAMTATSYLSFGQVPEWKAVESTTRAGRSRPGGRDRESFTSPLRPQSRVRPRASRSSRRRSHRPG